MTNQLTSSSGVSRKKLSKVMISEDVICPDDLSNRTREKAAEELDVL